MEHDDTEFIPDEGFNDIREKKTFNLPRISFLDEKKKVKRNIDTDMLKEKSRILDTLVKITDYNRCYASWVLRHYGKRHLMKIEGQMVELVAMNVPKQPQVPRPRVYDEPVAKTLQLIWETFDRMCGQRFRRR